MPRNSFTKHKDTYRGGPQESLPSNIVICHVSVCLRHPWSSITKLWFGQQVYFFLTLLHCYLRIMSSFCSHFCSSCHYDDWSCMATYNTVYCILEIKKWKPINSEEMKCLLLTLLKLKLVSVPELGNILFIIRKCCLFLQINIHLLLKLSIPYLSLFSCVLVRFYLDSRRRYSFEWVYPTWWLNLQISRNTFCLEDWEYKFPVARKFFQPDLG